MCLEHPPHFRARLVTYLSLLVNNIVPPPGRGWADVIEFEDHRLLNSTCDPPPQSCAALPTSALVETLPPPPSRGFGLRFFLSSMVGSVLLHGSTVDQWRRHVQR